MDVIPVGFVDLKQLLSGWSDTEEQLRQKVGHPFLVEVISVIRVRYGNGIAGKFSEGVFATSRVQFIAGSVGKWVSLPLFSNLGSAVVPCAKYVIWDSGDKSGRTTCVYDDDFPFGILMMSSENKMCRISVGEREVSERIEELFAQKPDGPQTLSALVFSSALKKVGVQMFGPNFNGQFTKEAERSLNDIVKGLLEIGGRSEVVATPHELNKINNQYATLVNAGMMDDDLCDLIATHVMRRTCGWFFRERGVHCVAVALGEGEK